MRLDESTGLVLLDTMHSIALRTDVKTSPTFCSIGCFWTSWTAVESKTNCFSGWVWSGATQLEDVIRHSNLSFATLFASFWFDPGLLHLQVCSLPTMACRRLGGFGWAWGVIFLGNQRQQGKGYSIALETFHELRIQGKSPHLIPFGSNTLLQEHLPHSFVSIHQLTHIGPRISRRWIPM